MSLFRTNIDQARRKLVEQDLVKQGIRDRCVLEAMLRVPREEFVPEHLRSRAYENRALPIDAEQTISQPYIVALMAESLQLKRDDKVLDVGTGSGYAAAVMSEIVDEVYSIERHQTLAESAQARLARLGYDNIHIRHGDGMAGWSEQAPFDAISVAAAGIEVPPQLLTQLSVGGRLVIPIGASAESQQLLCITRTETRLEQKAICAVRFVPLLPEIT